MGVALVLTLALALTLALGLVLVRFGIGGFVIGSPLSRVRVRRREQSLG